MESITDIRELPRLDDETVHVWGVHLPDVIDRLDILYTRLCVEEREKADRFFREQDRQASIAARGALRMLLAGYTQRTPREIDIRYTDNGKPHVAESDVDFNLSHSDEWVVLSFGRNRRIGVDLEKIRRDLDVQSIAARYFEPEEVALLDRAVDRHALFFQLWARKEAYVKACGSTLFRELGRFKVPLAGEDVPEEGESGGWIFRQLEAGSDYAAAVVTDRPLSTVTCYDFGGMTWEN